MLMFVVALCLSSVAAFYSIVGLTAIFAAAVVPIVIMGSFLEVAKLVVTVWLHEYWRQCRWVMKLYLVPAVGVLMLLTSMGIFGFLSKAHLDQAVPTGDVAAQVALVDEKIKTQRDNVEAARRALAQMDAQVDQRLSRSDDDKGAERAVQIRRAQARERQQLQADIAEAQKRIAALNEERAPIASQLRRVEAEVGPIKYIAALIYGDNPDANLLERAVRWVIIVLVAVFDPLAVIMLLAATESLTWERRARREAAPTQEPDTVQQPPEDPPGEPCPKCATPMLDAPGIGPFCPNKACDVLDGPDLYPEQQQTAREPWRNPPIVPYQILDENPVDIPDGHILRDDDPEDEQNPRVKQAMALWKSQNPGKTLKEQRALLRAGKIDHLPWLALLDQLPPRFSFGDDAPPEPHKGDMWINTQPRPHHVCKWNGDQWLQVDKDQNTSYTQELPYIDYLIQQLHQSRYESAWLTDAEADAITNRVDTQRDTQ